MNDDTFISDVANDIFGIQTKLKFRILTPPSSLELSGGITGGIDPSVLEKLSTDFPIFLTNLGCRISEINGDFNRTDQFTEVVFNQDFTLDDFVDSLEMEDKWKNNEEKEPCYSCMVGDGHFNYILVYQGGLWKFARQRRSIDTNKYSGYSGTTGTMGTSGPSGYAGTSGSSSFSGTSGPSGYAGSSMNVGLTGPTWNIGPSGPSGSNNSTRQVNSLTGGTGIHISLNDTGPKSKMKDKNIVNPNILEVPFKI